MNQKCIIVIILLYIHNLIYAHKFCTLPNGFIGICTDIRRCKDAATNDNLKICSFTPITLIVCCIPESEEKERKSQKFCDDFNLNVINKIGSHEDGIKYPHVATLGFYSRSSVKWICGGTLISSKFVLTSAICVDEQKELQPDISNYIVRLGSLKLCLEYESPQDFKVISIYKHSDYNSTMIHNLALLQLHKSVKYSKFVKPACLNTEEDIGVLPLTSPRWIHVGSLNQPELRMKVFNDLIELKNFSSYDYKKIYSEQEIEPNLQIAVGKYNEEKCNNLDISYGEGLISKYKMYGNLYRLIGIKSQNPNTTECSDVSFLVYTRISYYLDWIESIVWPEEPNDL